MYARSLAITLALASLWVAGTLAAKPRTAPPVPLIVHVDAGVAGISGDGVIAEGGATRYEDGVDGVTASLDQYGNLIVNFQVVRSAPIRKLHYDYGLPLDAQDPLPPADPPNNYISTQRHDGDPLKIQEMGIGQSGCYIAGVYYTLEDAKRTQYWHSYGRGVTGIDASANCASEDHAHGRRHLGRGIAERLQRLLRKGARLQDANGGEVHLHERGALRDAVPHGPDAEVARLLGRLSGAPSGLVLE